MNSPNSWSLDPQTLFPFELDTFQQKAIAALDKGNSVVVCAPTGSGKTVIAEYAIYQALSQGKRVFYTTPLKALSNQKYRDFQEKFADLTQVTVGLITGDMVQHPDGDIVVMTTEIFRNMLYETPIGEVGTSLEAVATVILDECHYISDRGRGTVWEESIIYCPASIQLVALSATIGNPEQLTDWINGIREKQPSPSLCNLINSDFRPVPLQFYYSQKKGLFPLLNQKQTDINNRLLPKKNQKGKKKRLRRQDCPSIPQIVEQLRERDFLPAIYIIFSRRGCDQAVGKLGREVLVTENEAKALYEAVLIFFLGENAELQQGLLEFVHNNYPNRANPFQGFLQRDRDQTQALLEALHEDPEFRQDILNSLAYGSGCIYYDQIEPITRGIASHHAGILPVWKEFIEKLFEMGLIKVVFATATLAAGINMPARTTVISALKRRTEDGHSLLTPSEFLQIAGRAGRRGMDTVGYVVTVETPYEGCKEAAYLATANPEPLRSCFAPSYGMVLNLLQKHSIDEVKGLLERSFAEYLAKLKLEPEQQSIFELTTRLTQLDIELAGFDDHTVKQYIKLNNRVREERRLLKILKQQADETRKKEILPLLGDLQQGTLLYLKGKHIRVSRPMMAVFVAYIAGAGKIPDLLCLGKDNHWYRAVKRDVTDLEANFIPVAVVETLELPNLENFALGKGTKGGDSTVTVIDALQSYQPDFQIPPEIEAQQQRLLGVESALNEHPLKKSKNPKKFLKSYNQRQELQKQLQQIQIRFQKLQSRKSYYWEEFLNLIAVLQKFNALSDYHPTPLGQAAATIRSENELWLGLVLISGYLEELQAHQLAGLVSALITEPLRPDAWVSFPQSPEVGQVFEISNPPQVSLKETRRLLNQCQKRYALAIPVWLEMRCVGLVEQWALGINWYDLFENTNLDDGDIVRLLRRTIDVLWQIPQIPGVSEKLSQTARQAIASMKRFPI
ncbi:MAG: DEAD/DEAH box helicase [Microcystaceae cyanobacterium]